jgi:site-specific DNA-methyltransferase (adenine-specific)
MLKPNSIHCIDVLEGLGQIDSNTCNIVIADPPYNIGKNFGNNFDTMDADEYRKWCKQWIDECIRVTKPNGTIFIYGFSEKLAYLFVDIKINKRWLVWHYTNKNVPTLKFWQRSHESIIACWKDKPLFNRDLIREPYTDTFLQNAAGKTRKNSVGRYSSGKKETIYAAHENGALPRDVIKISTLAGGNGGEVWAKCSDCNVIFNTFIAKNKHDGHKCIQHPTQKPLSLCKKLIKSCMTIQKRGLLLVPFLGSGSECVAARDIGVDYIGFDINSDYIEIAQTRLNSNTVVVPRDDADIEQGLGLFDF